jgi:hypothetical protein
VEKIPSTSETIISFYDEFEKWKGIEKTPKNLFKNSNWINRFFIAICEDYKEIKVVKNEANEIIKEITRKAIEPWETEYYEDKNYPWNYKLGDCLLRKRVCWFYKENTYHEYTSCRSEGY